VNGGLGLLCVSLRNLRARGRRQCDFQCDADRNRLWFANTLSDFEINDLAALPALFCYNS
jgi:hypothetical protein